MDIAVMLPIRSTPVQWPFWDSIIDPVDQWRLYEGMGRLIPSVIAGLDPAILCPPRRQMPGSIPGSSPGTGMTTQRELSRLALAFCHVFQGVADPGDGEFLLHPVLLETRAQ